LINHHQQALGPVVGDAASAEVKKFMLTGFQAQNMVVNQLGLDEQSEFAYF
jgi:hypothetical protein